MSLGDTSKDRVSQPSDRRRELNNHAYEQRDRRPKLSDRCDAPLPYSVQ
ncbi:MAG: hypothetical protein WBA10_11465 [Elainellaceae cyanobacterium]